MNTDNLLFEVKRIKYRNPKSTYTVLEGQVKNKKINNKRNIITIVGKFPFVLEKDEYEAEGVWHDNKIYGEQFVVTNIKHKYPETEKGLAEFLTKNVKGLGKRTAEKIVEELGINALDEIKSNYSCLLNIKGIKEDRAIKIHKEVVKHQVFEDLLVFIKSLGLSYDVTLKIYRDYEELSIVRLVNNPYSLEAVAFKVRERIAKNLNVPYDNSERIKKAIIYSIDKDIKTNGNLFIRKDDLLERVNLDLLEIGEYAEDLQADKILKEMDELELEDGIVRDGDAIYLKGYYNIENKIANYIKLKTKEPVTTEKTKIDNFLDNYSKIPLAEHQKQAVYVALQNSVSILTGGPGTGKTQTVNTIIEVLQHIKKDAVIHLLAPTGRASRRMAELTKCEAKTIHKGINLKHGDDNDLFELDGDIVIVDESSMIDAYVFSKLIECITPNTRLLLVGDYDQLPSVGAGLILRDLIHSGVVPTTRLTEVFRQAKESNIVSNAHKVINGQNDLSYNDNNKKDFYYIEKCRATQIKELILEKIMNLTKQKWFSLKDIQILVPMRIKDLGTEEFNALIQDKLNKSRKEITLVNKKKFKLGDRVIHTVNNYDLGVFNGEIGYITDVRDYENVIIVEYDDKEIEYDFTDLDLEDQLELAYAITIHKSQGSEFPAVIIPIHSSQKNMLNRNLLYTALTRAKKMVLLVGEKDSLNYSISNVQSLERNSNLIERLQK